MFRFGAPMPAVRTAWLSRSIHWPQSPNPSPYDIFGITPESFDKKRLPQIYRELAKKYHPDRHSADYNKPGCCLSLKERNQRFKAIGFAYQTLKDDARRRSWDIQNGIASRSHYGRAAYFGPRTAYSKNWKGGDMCAGPPPPGYHYTGGPKYWSGESGYEKFSQKDFERGLRENRMYLVKMVLAVVAVATVIELYALANTTEQHAKKLEQLHLEAEEMQRLAYANYGYGNSSADRIQRFKAQREGHLTLADGRSFSFNDLTQG